MVQWLRLCIPNAGAQVQSLVRELRSTGCNEDPPLQKKKKKKGKKRKELAVE